MIRTNFKSDLPSRFDEKKARAANKEANWRAVCRQVDKRDGWKCRACGRSCNCEAIDPLERGHRHHMMFRSKGGADVSSNLITLDAGCHDLLHRKRTLRIEATTPDGADGPCEFWRTGPDGEYLSLRETAVGQREKD